MRRPAKILVLSLVPVMALAGVAAASIYSSVPKTGHWTAQTTDKLPVSFKVKKRGHRMSIKGFTARLHIYCSGGDNPPAQAGDLTLSAPPIPVDANPNSGERGQTPTMRVPVSVPGVTGPVNFYVSAGFTSHHQYPPPGTIVNGEVDASFNKDNGDLCGVSVQQLDNGPELEGSIEWSGHPGH